ncbi:very short patch repair endonuclease [Lentilactobacillus fungorum]|uniref:Very short patch repair endonuclease n=1 Tax=Lentilactobacillus fungorum TaxID=2201250 RepID=A0ABQ3W0D3_9LACO|nr:very short patch repair endonuclease [Lentilactobacillus fungorum]GHP13921.1 very short patch repair endonuclease [Lentilactobacillus fungorum]
MVRHLRTTSYRSKMMSKIKSKGGKGETLLGKRLWHEGVRYRRNYKKLPGKPDIVITKYKIVIFVDGEFWHGYDWENQKKIRLHRNREFWLNKIQGNIDRDRREDQQLKKMGWTVLRFWEKHEVLKNPDACVRIILSEITKKKRKI